ncbi:MULTISPECIES: hypothetical protein [Sphingobacterium]|uniref:hypothetical protein n=1 Tax=Sphingobacterium TaxID=28453 RepID=UPI002579BAEE|nr:MULTISPECIES: hypothetical protein [Sphingobacterium]
MATGKILDKWLYLSSHEVGHLPQVEKHDGLISYFGEFAKQYTSSFIENGFSSNDGHDNAEYEKEADKGAVNFLKFDRFVNENIGKNGITDLLSGGLSEDKKIDILQRWINYYNSSNKNVGNEKNKK